MTRSLDPPVGRPAGRHGLSTLVLVAVLVGLVAVVQILQHVFTGQVTDQVARAVHGRMASGIATSALAEARHRLADQLNRPGTPLFLAVRQSPSSAPRPVPLAVSDLPHTRERLAQAYSGVLDITAVSARATPRAGLTTASATEYEGDLSVTVGVRSLIDTDVRRSLSGSWSYRLVNLAPDAPLAAVTALIRTPDQVFTGRWNVPDICRQYVQTDLPGILQEAKSLLEGLDREKAKATDASMKQQIDQLRAAYAPLAEGPGGGRLGTALEKARSALAALAALPARPSDYLLIAAAPEMPLGELRLQQDFDVLIGEHRTLKAQRDRLAETVKNSQAPEVHRQYSDTAGLLGEIMEKTVARYARFRAAFTVVPRGEPRYAQLTAAHDLVNPVGALPGEPAYPRFDTRISAIYSEMRAGAEPLEQALRRFMDGLAGDADPFAGVIMVENATRPLRLSGSHRGRWTMIVSGSLSVDGLTRADPASDIFTIVHLGRENTTLSLAGRVEATVVATGYRMGIAAGTQLTGGLFLEDVLNTTQVDPLATGPEKLTLDPVRAQMPQANLMRATLSPWTRATRLTRE